MMERRKTYRRLSYLGALIAFNNRSATLDCTIRNFSGDGAKITLDGAAVLPDEFDFTIVRNASCQRARIVWRDHREAGLALLGAEEGSIITLDWARRLRAREAQNATLRRRVADLSSGG